MEQLAERYRFNWRRIWSEDSYHIEYSVTDICNRNCAFCSHLAPLAKRPNFVSVEEFTRAAGIMRELVPDAHTFWLTGGEPTLHPEFMRLLKLAREIYPDRYVGIYSNGITLKRYESDAAFWSFIRNAGIVWAVTPYDLNPQYVESLFETHGCLNNLAIIQSGNNFFKLTNYARNQPVSQEKYEKCGWERSKINIRNGKIYNCPSAEFADLFNEYFDAGLRIGTDDYLEINERLTRAQIDAFRGPVPFCGQCDIRDRHRKSFRNAPSNKDRSEWSCFDL